MATHSEPRHITVLGKMLEVACRSGFVSTANEMGAPQRVPSYEAFASGAVAAPRLDVETGIQFACITNLFSATVH